MNNFFQYLFEVSLGSSILFLGYLMSKNWLPIKIKRFYLMACILLPLAFSLMEFNSSQEAITAVPQKISHVFISGNDHSNHVPATDIEIHKNIELPVKEEAGFELNWSVITTSLYLGFCVLFFGRFLFSLLSIYRLTKSASRSNDPTGYFLIKNSGFTGASFFNLIFIHHQYVDVPAFKFILSHEQIHQQRLHSLDILLSEFFLVLFWINPTAWFLRKEIRLTTEYEADQYTARHLGNDEYSEMLIELSILSNQPRTMNLFSATDTKKRIKQLINGDKDRWVNTLYLIPFIALSFWIISCEPQMTDFSVMDPKGALENVKTITTRYMSHQDDTQQKDSKIVAIAYYLPDGTVDKVEQHMIYPYDYEQPFKREFIVSPNPVGVPQILDGLNLGIAEKNMLYGNDWPKLHEKSKQRNFYDNEHYSHKVSVKKNSFDLPIEITTEVELNEDIFFGPKRQLQKGTVTSVSTEEFEYDDGKVISNKMKVKFPDETVFAKSMSEEIESKYVKDIQFQYEDKNLIEVRDHEKTYKFYYQNNILTSSDYYKNDTRYNYRNYYYNESGLKTRTEIFNVYGDPEYTILYEYEYY